ncbi:hypothetical protein C9374_014631 [Naegleria lovaniensis]|uniref:Uncharacterized protein n=1 Tax=Naegleria lovaniensis TaxID=51637 RepID=A0AA88KQ20_NAELO|nr:uncharacterized protein C9374_014631 [Naegleria lovaniensis]KAG2389231.1 hypothetical protein C9374_014631 [Naegleria lovaniensis]
MFCFLVGVASGVYLHKNYDIDRLIADMKPKFASENKDSVWERMKKFEQKYRKEVVAQPPPSSSTPSTPSEKNDSSSK